MFGFGDLSGFERAFLGKNILLAFVLVFLPYFLPVFQLRVTPGLIPVNYASILSLFPKLRLVF